MIPRRIGAAYVMVGMLSLIAFVGFPWDTTPLRIGLSIILLTIFAVSFIGFLDYGSMQYKILVSPGVLKDLVQSIRNQASSLEGYAKNEGYKNDLVPSVFHIQADHFRTLANHLEKQIPKEEKDVKS